MGDRNSKTDGVALPILKGRISNFENKGQNKLRFCLRWYSAILNGAEGRWGGLHVSDRVASMYRGRELV